MGNKTLFHELRKEMYGKGIVQKDIAQAVGKSVGYVSLCLNGKQSWHLSDCYAILALLGIGDENLPLIFPRST